jgi:hypothetical protein
MYTGYKLSNTNRCIFRKIRKDNRILHQIDDSIVQIDDLMTCQLKTPFDIAIRSNYS